MPEKLGSCISDRLLVCLIKRLSVVDVGVIPMVLATHLQASVYAIAEKGAGILESML